MAKLTEQHDQEPISLRAILKDKQELHKIIKPNCEPYEEKPYSREEARQINEASYEEPRVRADKAIYHPAQANIARATSITQLRPDQLNNYVEYGKTAAAMKDMFEAQIGPQIKQMIPIPVFNKILTRVDLVNFTRRPRESNQPFYTT